MSISSFVKTVSGPFTGPGATFPLGFPAEGYSQITVWRYNDAEGLSQELSQAAGDFSAQFFPEGGAQGFGSVTIEGSRGVDVPGDYFFIASVLPEEQGTVFSSFGRFDPEVHERALDKVVMLVKQLRGDLERVFTPSADPQGPVVINADTINIAGMEWLDYLIQAQADARVSADEALAAKAAAEFALSQFESQWLGEFSDPLDFPVSPAPGSVLFFGGGPFGPIGLYSYFGDSHVDSHTGTPWVLSARKGDKGDQGNKGDRGTDAVQFKWLGSLPDYPASPEDLSLFHHEGLKQVLLYSLASAAWTVFAIDGLKGDTGLTGPQGASLRWRGNFSGSTPSDPVVLDLFRDTLNNKTMFYDGTAWVLWVQDGPQGIKGDRGDSLRIDATGTMAGRSAYDGAGPGFSYFAYDYTISPSSAPREAVFTATSGGSYPMPFAPKGEQAVTVSVNGIIQSTRAYSFDVTGGVYTLLLTTTVGDEIVVRELDFASGTGALYIKASATSGHWSAPIPFGQGPKGDTGPAGADGTDGNTGPQGKTLVWKGALAVPPSDPEDFWAYRDTGSRTLKFYHGGQWWEWAKDGAAGASGVDGLNATEINWQGAVSTLPSSPSLFTLVRYTGATPNTLMFWDGTQWNEWAKDGVNGSNGSNGAAARNFFWRGEGTSDPASPDPSRGGSMELDVYRNTSTKKVRCFIAGSWRDWALDGAPGAQGNQGPAAPEPPPNSGGDPVRYVRQANASNGGFSWVPMETQKASSTVYGVAKIYVSGDTLFIQTT